MGRRNRGDLVDGWMIVDKPEGLSSTQIVGRVRRALNASKAGHAGTLDPLATGLVAVALGEATKTVPYAQEGLKTYQFTARWGEASTTDDREGEICARSDVRPSKADIEAILPRFIGDIMQTPPVFSAIKIDGARAYDLARKGAEVEMKARPIRIESLKLIDMPDADHALFEMICGKGGYVRSMARDLGEALGTCAHVTTLRRLASGGFDVSEAVQMDELDCAPGDPEIMARLLPVEAGLSGLQRVDLDPVAAARLSAGDASAVPLMDAPDWWAASNGQPVAILGQEAGAVVIRRVFRFA